MNESFLRAINPSVPLRDLEAAVWMVIVGICVANLVVISMIAASKPRAALTVALVSCVGVVGAWLIVQGRPELFYPTAWAYAAGFAVLGIVAAREASTLARNTALLAPAGLALLLLAVYLLAFTSR